METFTIAFPVGLCPLDWQNGDCLLHLSHAPFQGAAPNTFQGDDQIYGWKQLRMETFRIAFPDEISSLDWQCTKPLYKATRRSSIIGVSADQADSVSLSLLQHTCKLFDIYHTDPKAIFAKFCLSERRLQRRPTLHRHKVKLTGFLARV